MGGAGKRKTQRDTIPLLMNNFTWGKETDPPLGGSVLLNTASDYCFVVKQNQAQGRLWKRATSLPSPGDPV
jgi:hypothetical protein